MIEIIPASQLKEGDVFSTDGYIVSTVVLLPKTSRVFVQAALDGHLKTEALAQDFPCPIYREEEVSLEMPMERLYKLHALAARRREAAEDARAWLLDCFSEPEDVEDIGRLNQIQLVQSVDTHYEGGYRQFLADSFNLKDS